MSDDVKQNSEIVQRIDHMLRIGRVINRERKNEEQLASKQQKQSPPTNRAGT